MLLPVTGYLADHYGRKHSASMAFALLSAGLLLLPFASAYSSLCVVAIICGLGFGLSSGSVLRIEGLC